eukprot:CAMPEP_0198198890 /NCGR_PEP_ID=MMETSP1445-20131203/2253_1 /TAXON_ID=36898 /ORGANISM="Pyramimonas sp., Strain CCMP2087" /LENGTH=281 /DNA_ID=CAMNT_0043868559 /DNA_START=110 /DNA_END=955 /DNA_ORIENTATION=-
MSRTVGINVVAHQAIQSKQTQKVCLSAPKGSFTKGAVLRTTRVASAVSVSRQALSVRAGPTPTISDTKAKFINAYTKPIPAVFNTILQEMIVLQHINRYTTNYKYTGVSSLGFTSVFDQIFEKYTYGDSDAIFRAYVDALDESPTQYRADAAKLVADAPSAKSVADLAAMPEVAAMAAMAAEKKLVHNRFNAIGLFRLLELAGLTDPSALQELVKASGMNQEMVNRDLMTYKGLLSKLSAGKEMLRELTERENKKTAERMAEKAAKAAKDAARDAAEKVDA